MKDRMARALEIAHKKNPETAPVQWAAIGKGNFGKSAFFVYYLDILYLNVLHGMSHF